MIQRHATSGLSVSPCVQYHTLRTESSDRGVSFTLPDSPTPSCLKRGKVWYAAPFSAMKEYSFHADRAKPFVLRLGADFLRLAVFCLSNGLPSVERFVTCLDTTTFWELFQHALRSCQQLHVTILCGQNPGWPVHVMASWMCMNLISPWLWYHFNKVNHLYTQNDSTTISADGKGVWRRWN